MKKLTFLFLASVILLLSGHMFAKEQRGANLIIQKKNGTQVRGELISAKQSSLLLMERDSGRDITTNIEDVAVITIVKKSKTLLGTGVGLVAGALASSIWWMSVQESDDKSIINGYALAAGGGGGALIGAIVGTAAGKEKTIPLEGKSDSEIKEILIYLNKKARVKNHQQLRPPKPLHPGYF